MKKILKLFLVLSLFFVMMPFHKVMAEEDCLNWNTVFDLQNFQFDAMQNELTFTMHLKDSFQISGEEINASQVQQFDI